VGAGLVLDRLSEGQAIALAVACEQRATPGTALNAAVSGATPASYEAVAKLATAWSAMPSLTGDGVALGLRVGLEGRRRANAARSRPVWTGPGASGERRLTAAVLRDLVKDARHRVLLVSFAAFTLADLAEDLAAAVDRGCAVDVVFETESDSSGAYHGPQVPFAAVSGIRRWRWPAEQRAQGALLHAKVLVIDGRRALVGSANLTQRALAANLEAGILVQDPSVASELESHIRGLMDQGVLLASASDG
jgi:cardiolipin synthase C